jgi:hypothetical protein
MGNSIAASRVHTKVWKSMAEVRAAHAAREWGNHWFETGSMQFFRSKIESGILKGRYFITSEINPSDEKRYSIRYVTDDAQIETLGEFHSYKTKQDAKDAIPL